MKRDKNECFERNEKVEEQKNFKRRSKNPRKIGRKDDSSLYTY